MIFLKKEIIRESKCSWSLRTSGGCACLAVLVGGSGRGGGGVGGGWGSETGGGGGLGVDGFQCSWKQLRKTQGPGSHSPNRLVSVTYSSQHLNLTPTHTHTETYAQTHTKWASLLKKEARLSVTPAFVLWGMAYMYVCVCVCLWDCKVCVLC